MIMEMEMENIEKTIELKAKDEFEFGKQSKH